MATQPAELFKTVNPEEGSLDADGFVGVDPIYQNNANKVDAPLEGNEDDKAQEKAPRSDEGGADSDTGNPANPSTEGNTPTPSAPKAPTSKKS